MTDYVINTPTTSTQVLAANDSLAVIGGVNLDVLGNNAIYGTAGDMVVTVAGYVYGDITGFFDNSSVGGNNLSVGAGGSITSRNIAIFSYGGSNTVNNAGTIGATTAQAIDFAGSNTIMNSGVIYSSVTAIQLNAGFNFLENTGTIQDGTKNINVAITGADNTILNYGSIVGGTSALYLSDGGNEISNGGVISGATDGIKLAGTNNSSNVDNSGKIYGYYGIDDLEYYTTISNSGTISGTYGIYFSGSSGLNLTNSGTTTATYAGIYAYNGSAYVDNTGTLSGASYAAIFSGANNTLLNSGHISGAVYFGSGSSVYNGALGSASGTIYAGSGSNTFTGGAGTETFSLSGGTFDVDGGGGNDTFFAYNNLTSTDRIDGGAGNDLVQLYGDYSAGLLFTPTTMVNVETLQLVDGYNYKMQMNDAQVAAGQRLTVDASGLSSPYGLTINAANETDGYYTILGGAGGDSFTFSAAHFSANDIVQGGSGTAVDTLRFSTAGTITAAELAGVSGIETFDLGNGANSFTLTDALVASANGTNVRVNGGTGADTIDASGVASGHKDILDGGGGADSMIAGAGKDTFFYAAASDSTGPNYDTIANMNFSGDLFNLPGTNPITGINTAVTTGSLSSASFNSDLVSDITASKLGANHAVLFTASAGTLAGQTFLIADLNGTAGYQANADLVVHLTGATGTLATTNFV